MVGSAVQCVLDRSVVNHDTIHKFTNIGLSIFAVLCGKNRGVFVTTNTDPGNTYSCLTLPPSFQDLLSNPNIPMSTSNDIDLQFKAGNITGEETIGLLEELNTAIFDSSGDSSNAYDPYSCNLNGLSTYINCPFEDTALLQLHTKTVHEYRYDHHHDHDHDRDVEMETVTLPKLRGVTTVGMFVPTPWASQDNDGFLHYDADVFSDMYDMGLNTILIPVPTDHSFWHPEKERHDHHKSHRLLLAHPGPKEPKGSKKEKESKHKSTKGSKKDAKHEKEPQKIESKETKKRLSPVKKVARDVQYLLDVIDQAEKYDLYVILQLVGPSSKFHEIIEHIIDDVVTDHSETVIGLQLPTSASNDAIDVDYSSMVSTIRKYSTHLPIFVPVSIGQLAHVKAVHHDDAKHIYSALSMDHTTSVADVASSASLDDRMKLYYHENVACTQRSPIDYIRCYKNMPALITSGFDLAIDNCAFQYDTTVPFVNYGQCDRWDETIDSQWWHRHRQSLAVRKLASFEQGLGWVFAAWKVGDDETKSGTIATPAQLHSFTAVSSAGLFPDLHTYVVGSNDLGDDIPACLNPPLDDFILGDETLSPVPAPPPDCGNGWWNYTIQDCSYWVPPPPPPPCPVCEVCDGGNITDETWYNITDYDSSNITTEEASDELNHPPTHYHHHIHHHLPNSSEEVAKEDEILFEGMSKSMINSNAFDNGFGLHHMGVAFMAGMFIALSTIAFIYEYKKQNDYRNGYEVIQN